MPFIDVHAHLIGTGPGTRETVDYPGAVKAALAWMDRLNIVRTIVMPMPFGPSEGRRAFDIEAFAEALHAAPGRFAMMGGGGSLNITIHESQGANRMAADAEKRLRDRAERIIALGAVGFGEMSCEHLSFNSNHPYNAAPPDHPLFLLLADIAAGKNLPIDIHMEAVPADMAMPQAMRERSPNNPPTLRANIEAFRRLLAHNRRARIVWAHAGMDSTGFRTPALCRALLGENANLSMHLQVSRLIQSVNHPLDEAGKLRAEWHTLLTDFPDRFMIGSDAFYFTARVNRFLPPPTPDPRILLNQLESALARRVAFENAERVYNLPPI
ncbi:MAG: amidohydrolase family protein [Proteobacteria bacterium]|nr:amidohydrolase family protein [Pseudomonadota bacterium]